MKVTTAWCLYDWANSVYLLVITSTIFPVYYNNVTVDSFGGEEVLFFGIRIVNTVLYSYALSFSFLIVALLSPLLSGIADYGDRKKDFLRFFTYLGAISSAGLYFFTGHNVEVGIILSVFASIGYAGSLVFYNAFLPEITTSDKYDQLSAKGYSFGYIGSVILLLFNLILIEFHETIGFSNEIQAVRISFLLVGVWWFVFAQISLAFLPGQRSDKIDRKRLLFMGYQEITTVFGKIRKLRSLKLFLFSFLLYSTGVQTVMFLAATFGDKELHLESSSLILTVLIIQLVAIAGAYLFAYISKLWGNAHALLIMIIIWVGICVYAYFLQNEIQFYVLAFFVGLVMGGIQSLSRSTYSKLIPKDTNDTTSYYSFYDVVEKVSIVLGTFSYGVIEQITGSMRNGTIALIIYFLFGMILLLSARIETNTLSRPAAG